MHLNRLPEAEANLQQALELDPTDAQALANRVVINTLSGKKRWLEVAEDAADAEGDGHGDRNGHPLLQDLREKEALFDEAMEKYRPRVTVAG